MGERRSGTAASWSKRQTSFPLKKIMNIFFEWKRRLDQEFEETAWYGLSPIGRGGLGTRSRLVDWFLIIDRSASHVIALLHIYSAASSKIIALQRWQVETRLFSRTKLPSYLLKLSSERILHQYQC